MTEPPAGSGSPGQPAAYPPPYPGPAGYPAAPTHPGPPGYYSVTPGHPGLGPGGSYPSYPPGRPGYPSAPPSPEGTNSMAITALVLGICGAAPVAAVFGIIALRQTKATGQRGRGMAIWGLVLSGVWLVFIAAVALLALQCARGPRRDGRDRPAVATIAATDLQPGDCVNGLSETGALESLPGVPCAVPHAGEVYAVFDLPAGDYPGASELDRQTNVECDERFRSYAPSAYADPEWGIYIVYPLERSWALGDREVVCIASALADPVTGSIRGR